MNTDRWTPPGYYVASEDGTCAHCGVGPLNHTGSVRYCPAPPLELTAPAVRQAS